MFVQAEEKVMGKHIHENFANFKKNGADVSTAIPSTWLKWKFPTLIHIFLDD